MYDGCLCGMERAKSKSKMSTAVVALSSIFSERMLLNRCSNPLIPKSVMKTS